MNQRNAIMVATGNVRLSATAQNAQYGTDSDPRAKRAMQAAIDKVKNGVPSSLIVASGGSGENVERATSTLWHRTGAQFGQKHQCVGASIGA